MDSMRGKAPGTTILKDGMEEFYTIYNKSGILITGQFLKF